MKRLKGGKGKLFLSAVTVVLLGLLVGAGFLGFQIKTALEGEIYGTPRGEIESRTPENFGLSYDRVQFESQNNLTVKGWFIDGSTDTCIILAPGKGQNRWTLLDYAPFLHQAGYDLLLFDPRGAGRSEGKRWGFGYLESRDVLESIRFLKAEYSLESIGVLGRSAGATAALIAALEGTQIDAVVADSPFASIKLASESYGNYKNNPLFDIVFPLYSLGANQMLGVDVNAKSNLQRRIGELEIPVLFIHGKEDEVLFPKNSRILYQKKPDPRKLWMVDGAGHVDAFDQKPEKYKDSVIRFFDSHLPK